jgi:hypothetical protein
MSEAAPSGQLAEKRKPIEVKVYIVCQRRNLARPGERTSPYWPRD